MTFDRKEYQKEYYRKNKAIIKERNEAWRKANPDKWRAIRDGWWNRHLEQNRERGRKNVSRRRAEARNKIFEILGGKKCVRCGFSDERALQFDHINGDGRLERRQKGGLDYYLFYYAEHPEIVVSKFQVLCANCNWIKRAENKEHRYFSLRTDKQP